MSWKDYFYFTQKERNGLIVLSCLIIGIALLPYIYTWLNPAEPVDFSEFEEKVEEYRKLKEEYLAAQETLEAKKQAEELNKTAVKENEINLTPYPFDPNVLSLEEFTALGLPGRIARNIINYRNAGGKFEIKKDLEKIYTIDRSLYTKLEPFILLPEKIQEEEKFKQEELTHVDKIESLGEKNIDKQTEIINIDMNLADTTEWQKIRGIGSVFSRRIVSYRELLGGFSEKNQLMEVYGMDEERYQKIESYIANPDISSIRKIDINNADFVTLLRHPYLNKNQVNSIIKIREKHGPFSVIDDIKQSKLIDQATFIKISPYLEISNQ